MDKFLKALELAAQKLTKENLQVAVELATEVVAADKSRYERRGRWPSAADELGWVRSEMENETLLEGSVLFGLESLARYYSARKKRCILVEPGVWTLGDDPNVVRIRHDHGKWAVLVSRPTVHGTWFWETHNVSGIQEAYLLACYHLR